MKNNRTEEEYREAAKKSFSIAGMCRELGLKPFGASYRSIHKAIEKYSIDVSHFTGCGWNVGLMFNPNEHKSKIKLEDILVENSDYDSTSRIKDKLLESGLKEYKCEKCNRTEWEGEAIPLQLHHVNGKRNDNRIENLQLLCPNCHAQTDNFCGKNKSKESYKGRLTEQEKIEIATKVYGEKFAIEFFQKVKERRNKKIKEKNK